MPTSKSTELLNSTSTSEAQSEAYETLLKQAAEHGWTKVLNVMMEDGFLKDMDYVTLLELWEVDGL